MPHSQPDPRPFVILCVGLFVVLFAVRLAHEVRHGFGPTFGADVLFLAAVSGGVAIVARWAMRWGCRRPDRQDEEDYDDGPGK